MADDQRAVIENILVKCGRADTGRVRVSSVIEYLRSEARISNHNLDTLSSLLDPKGVNREVKNDEFREKAAAWIQSIQDQALDDELDGDEENVSGSCFSFKSPGDFVENSSAISADSIEGYGGESSSVSKSLDVSELLSSAAEMKKHIQKLQKDREKLQDQLNLAEDANTQLTADLNDQKRHFRSQESELERAKARSRAQEEMRRQEQDLLADFSKKSEQLERKNQALEGNLVDVQEQLKYKAQCLESLEDEHGKLAREMNARSSEGFEDGDSGSMSRDQSLGNVEELVRFINQLKADNQDLERDKNELERNLSEANERLQAVHAREKSPVPAPMFTSTPFRLSPQSEVVKEEGEVEEDRRRRRRRNLASEIDGPIIEDGMPLTEEQKLRPLTSSFDQFTVIASQAQTQFQQKTEKTLQLVSELSAFDPSRYSQSEVVKTELEESEVSFKIKLERLVKSKEKYVEKIKKLQAKVDKLTLEKKELIEQLKKEQPPPPVAPDVPELEHAFKERIGNLSETVALCQNKADLLTERIRNREEDTEREQTSLPSLESPLNKRRCSTRSCLLWALFLFLALITFVVFLGVHRFPGTTSQCSAMPRGFGIAGEMPQ